MLVDSILDKKGSDITLLDIREQAVFADYFLICCAENDRQLRAIANGITADAKEHAELAAYAVEGQPSSGWVLIDYGDLIIHLFSPEKRAYYDLESLWNEAQVVLQMQ